MATAPSEIHVHVKTNFIRNDDVRKLRDLLDELRSVVCDSHGPVSEVFLVGCIAGIDHQVDEMFGAER